MNIRDLPNELLEKIANRAVVGRMNVMNTFPFRLSNEQMDRHNQKLERSKQRDLFQALFNKRRSFRPRKK